MTCLVIVTITSGLWQSPPDVEAQEVEQSGTPTLEELKVLGAQNSIYRKLDSHVEDAERPVADLKEFRETIEPVLRRVCYECHGAETAEGEFRVDTLNPDLLQGDDASWWLEVSSAVGKGEMPPEDGPELPDDEREAIVTWLAKEVQKSSRLQRERMGSSSFRRMTRYEYNYAMLDLLGIEFDDADLLPPDPISPEGFENTSETLQMTGEQYSTYLELNRNALNRATVSGDRPDVLYWGISADTSAPRKFAESEKAKEQTKRQNAAQAARSRQQANRYSFYKHIPTGTTAPATWTFEGAVEAWSPSTTRPNVVKSSEYAIVLPHRRRHVIDLGNRLPDEGMMRVRIRAARTSVDDDAVPSLALEFGWQVNIGRRESYRISNHNLVVDASPGEPKFYQWDIPLSNLKSRNPKRTSETLGDKHVNPSEFIRLFNTSDDQSADIQFDYVEISAPLYEQWPPETHRAIFVDSANRNDEMEFAREIISRFMRRAWRRDVTEAEVDLKMELFASVRPACNNFEQAIVETLSAVLSSPRFLYLATSDSPDNKSRESNDFELATRLSIFLWCSVPDDELLDLASQGRLRKPEELVRQTQRMLNDKRHERFSKHFVRQWLNLAPLEFVSINRKAYPQFDDSLMDAMQQEPVALFEQVLQDNLSVMDFLHADYAIVNKQLAEHYGLEAAPGNEFQRVRLRPEDHRGGLLPQAAILAMNSDGTESHPLKRGMWLLESILNDPPPPPPPAVPEIDLADPEILKLTLRERMEDHRNKAACMSCHVKIDPWGIAFENFDALGNWRTERNEIAIDSQAMLYNVHELNGIEGVKRFLLAKRQDQFARAMIEKMATFALGRTLTFSDRAEIEQITAKLRKNGDGLQSLILELVQSALFRDTSS
ncbi:DUF1592 domain-containing protein [Bremerella sp. JC770]|uniref:DUF1592 domain-containing protein n=1 Tax=Bremerella sp. JC770 TaxID=3232137 RepID=UPI00345A386B